MITRKRRSEMVPLGEPAQQNVVAEEVDQLRKQLAAVTSLLDRAYADRRRGSSPERRPWVVSLQLGPLSVAILEHLYESGAAPLETLSETLGKDRGTVRARLAELAQCGVVVNEAAIGSKGVYALTDAGRALVERSREG